MSGQTPLHADDIPVDEALVRRLVDDQFPQWAGLPLRRIRSAGTVNAIFRLGHDLAVRIPRAESYVWDLESLGGSHQWLRWARPQLSLTIPDPVAIGEATPNYPWPWPIHRWIPGQPLEVVDLSHSADAAERLAGFVNALHALPAANGPRSSKAISRKTWTGHFERVISELGNRIDTNRAREAWQYTLAAPSWTGPFPWTHADLLPGNLLAREDQLVGVVDFECLGVGDPALDLTPAWAVFDRSTRRVFRDALDIDQATWTRAANCALRHVAGIKYYETTNPVFSAMCRRAVNEVLDDIDQGSILC